MNFVEWFALITMSIGSFINFIDLLLHIGQNEAQLSSRKEGTITHPQLEGYIVSNLMTLSESCVQLGLILMACLCLYLAANYARKSWISANRIPGLIASFLSYAFVNQILASFCSIVIISMWLNTLLTTVATIVVIKEYRQLCMVISWSIADLSASKNNTLKKKQVRMKRNFQRIFLYIWIGLILIIAFQYLKQTLITIGLVLRISNSSYIDISICEDSPFSTFEKSYIYTLLFRINESLIGIAILIIYVPYIGYGFSTMYIIIWRRVRGKTGYQTRFHNQLSDSPFA